MGVGVCAGKMFLATPKVGVVSHLQTFQETSEQRERDLETRLKYLETRLTSQEARLQEARVASAGS
jgi:hypothetical protein